MFKKWVDIENHYRSKYINKFFSTYPDLYNELFYITEKIDGANFSIIISSDQEIKFAKRSGILNKDSKFYDYETIFYPNEETSNYNKSLSIFIKSLLYNYVSKNNCIIQLVGELFGKGIQKRVYYGEGKYWRWFATYKDQVLLSLDDEISLIDDIGFSWSDVLDFRVPLVGTFQLNKEETFEERLNNININRNSLLTPPDYKEDNLMEGVVIRPSRDYYIGHDRFIIKYKNEKFKDVQKKNKKPKKKVSEEVRNVVNTIVGYVNENRTKDLFSKHGEINEPNQLGEYIKYYLEDVYNEYNKEHSLEEFSKEDKKYINKQLTNEIVKELRNYL
jgi:Rnl2 family RNA ligase